MTPSELAAFTHTAAVLVAANDDHGSDWCDWEAEVES